jgi:hypothetical protein
MNIELLSSSRILLILKQLHLGTYHIKGDPRGSEVVKALFYMPEGREFDTR